MRSTPGLELGPALTLLSSFSSLSFRSARIHWSIQTNASDLPIAGVIFNVCSSPSNLLLRVPTYSDTRKSEFAQPLCDRPDQQRSMIEDGAGRTGSVPDNQHRNGAMEKGKLNLVEGDSVKMESGSKNNASPPLKSESATAGPHSSPKKRRKVNHGKNGLPAMHLARIMVATTLLLRAIRGFPTTLLTIVPRLCSMRLLSTIAYDLRLGTTFLIYFLPSLLSCNILQASSSSIGISADFLVFVLHGIKERPCTRCIKRNIGHLCHDEPREPSKRARSEHEFSAADEEGQSNNEYANVQGMPRNVDIQDAAGQQLLADGTIALPPSSVNSVQNNNIPSSSAQGMGANSQQLLGYNDWLGGQSQFQDMHTFHPSYMFNAPEVTNEYNLLGDFLSSSLLDDGGMFQNDNLHGLYSDPTLINSMATLDNGTLVQQTQPPQPAQNQPATGDSIQGSSSVVVNDKARETYYMTAADPSGSDPPEERMNKLLKAKYDAGLLKPFNYVKGYARLNQYMEKHMQQASRQKILRQLDKFRPKFRERMQSLTDIELILVEMWFERSLMEYDRVFASMAIPACCWRRTGEIFRGNKEMAELIGVPIESLRDGKLAIHEIIVEDQLVSYWEKFGAIAFDNTQKAMLTSCTLKNPNSTNSTNGIACCFSFTIRRDNHNM
ncbi:gluconeogenesis transcription factor RDS2 [Aspergillus clavatus NRRL 1]|uniref:Zn cluster transcription factor Rds2, putative n=1 Tax=Aspergillus clavatus (strain ATCC 1007 / CBS 513.65 / DSM 816 / NCTC 3887 / NRRL 1 / QM 1276 / 107) TaxID=344612 RepID=A1C6R4_ASPCL|nr:Zn cluster transcription factor Rds2, putative [Aspergillus clavatus NRRL 1]EAW14085.1 Zn cluster transcription factor Rds2, putative [Aspergillus clavatus NRRL 1]